ncbi:MAG TPA: glycosyltransferase family A protein [Saprospiraceae bacterium]|nr:glycosyltransferase family A protein [Saprospiraceae bacterium]HMP23672.1 glycosyltransferase family A protein [Saprospiraceae bacterium]
MIISIIIPCYNVEAYIEECLDSVRAQTYPHLEVICVDNNSTDDTYQTIESYKKKHVDFPITLLKEPKPGASAARNAGLRIATGEWIQFLDADDLLELEKIEHQKGLIDENRKAVLVIGAYCKKYLDQKHKLVYPEIDDPYKSIFGTKMGITSSNLWSKAQLLEIKGWHEGIGSSQEYELMFRLIQINSCVILDNTPLTIVREREKGQITKSDPDKVWTQYLQLRVGIMSYLRSAKPSYWDEESQWYYQKLALQISTYAKYNLSNSNQYHERYIPRGNKLQPSKERSPFFIFIYNLLGYRTANLLRHIKYKASLNAFKFIQQKLK